MKEQPIPKVSSIIFGEERRTDSLKAYKAESELKRAVRNNSDIVEKHLNAKFKLPHTFHFKKIGVEGSEEYSLIDMINSKLIGIRASTCLDTYNIYKQEGIEVAMEKLHLQSNFGTI